MGFQENQNDISVADGRRIVAEAATWKGTPYSLVGPGSVKNVGGDCSGSTNLIYKATVFPYPYKTAAEFRVWAPTSKLFRQLGPLDHPQDGDILSWSSHMAIYSTFADDKDDATTPRVNKAGNKYTQTNDMWTAFHVPKEGEDPKPYAPFKISYFRPDKPIIFRYQKQ